MQDNYTDHDLIITLNAKFDQMSLDLKEVKDNLIVRMAKVESRLDAMDVYHAKIDLKHFEDNSQWIDGFRANYKLVLGIISVLTGIIEGLIVLYIGKITGFH